MPQRTPQSSLRAAIKIAGDKAALARICDVERQQPGRWLKTGKIPPSHVLTIEAATGISRYALRPDIFGKGEPDVRRSSQSKRTRTARSVQRRRRAA